MKLFRITFLFMSLSLSSLAKDTTTIEFKRFAFGIHASPDYCYRTLSIATNFRNDVEEPMWSYTGGIDFSYFIKKKFSLSLGVNYSQKGYQIVSIPTADANGDFTGMAHIRYNYNYVEIPVKATLLFGKKNVRFLASAGVNSAFMLYQQTISKIDYSNGAKETKKGKPNYIYNPFNLFLNGSFGVDCKLGKKMGLRIEPTYSYGLFETISASYSEHLWSAGLNVGCYIGL